MKPKNNLKNIVLFIIIIILLFQFTINHVLAIDEDKLSLDIYKIDLSKINSYSTTKKGTGFNLVLLDDISTKSKTISDSLNLEVQDENIKTIKASGLISKSKTGKRFSMNGQIELAANKLYLDNGQEVYISSSSSLFTSIHPPHANNNSLGLARTITSLSIGTSPLTFGASLGISFLVNGILSAHQNGISDFFWGGVDGSGLSFIENIFRKQPDIFLSKGTLIPFTLNEDLKINNGIQKEKVEYIKLNQEEAISKIEQLLRWGDLAGALELAVITGNEDLYEEIMKKIES